MTRIAIVGGGITGLATAHALAARGASVSLFEARRLGAMASTWTLGGVRQSGRDPAELPLARAAIERWSRLDDVLGAPTGYRRRGNLRLARTEAEVEGIRAMVATQRARGLSLEFLESRADIRAIAPAMGEAVLAASFCPSDGHADPEMTIAAYATALSRAGVMIGEGAPVQRLVTAKGRVTGVQTVAGIVEADAVVLAAGIHAPALLAPLGIDLPMAAKRVCVLRTVAAAPAFEQVFGVANADCAGRQEIGGAFRITTGIGDWPGDPARWTEDALRPPLSTITELIDRTVPLLPLLAGLGLERCWGGLIDLTPDALPVLDAPAEWPGLVIGAGFSGHGFGIGPVSGEILAALALREATPFALEPFRLARFASLSGQAPLTLHG
ncbi:MAG: FAD-binding oxidoreductase [Methylobacterium sp.]|nr:FAD-binding oxidoreductase [Methylobacterium sp.]MCA3637353.1 FAD-binding oxidoreductase [Methylobacterium sp.]